MEALAPWAEPVLTTADELLELPEDGWSYELVEGRLVRMAPAGPIHGDIEVKLIYRIAGYVWEHKLGKVLPSDTGFWVSPAGSPDTVLAADLAFVRRERVPPEWGEGYARLTPDFVVEVLSPSQSRAQMGAKARRWLNAGVDLVWVVLPKPRAVEVWRAGERVRIASEDDELSGEDLLPGFVLPVRELFS